MPKSEIKNTMKIPAVSVNSDEMSMTIPDAMKITPRMSNTLAIHGARQKSVLLSQGQATDVISLMCSCFSFIITTPLVVADKRLRYPIST